EPGIVDQYIELGKPTEGAPHGTALGDVADKIGNRPACICLDLARGYPDIRCAGKDGEIRPGAGEGARHRPSDAMACSGYQDPAAAEVKNSAGHDTFAICASTTLSSSMRRSSSTSWRRRRNRGSSVISSPRSRGSSAATLM